MLVFHVILIPFTFMLLSYNIILYFSYCTCWPTALRPSPSAHPSTRIQRWRKQLCQVGSRPAADRKLRHKFKQPMPSQMLCEYFAHLLQINKPACELCNTHIVIIPICISYIFRKDKAQKKELIVTRYLQLQDVVLIKGSDKKH